MSHRSWFSTVVFNHDHVYILIQVTLCIHGTCENCFKTLKIKQQTNKKKHMY